MIGNYTRRQILGYGSAALGAGLMLGNHPSQAASNFKVAIVLPGNITDGGWNQEAYEAMPEAKKKFGIETAYVEKVAQVDHVEALSDFARRGFNLVIAHGGEFDAAVKQVASQFPKAFFAITDGALTGSNIATMGVNHLQIAYLIGTIAGMMTKTNKVAFLVASSFETTDQEKRGFELGAKAVNPKVSFTASYTNDWDDLAKAKEATLALISAGVDVIYPELDNALPAVLQTATEKGIYTFGYPTDKLDKAPKSVLTSSIQDYRELIVYATELAMKSQLKGQPYVIGLERPDILALGKFNPLVPETVKKKAMDTQAELIAGKIAFKECQVDGKRSWCTK